MHLVNTLLCASIVLLFVWLLMCCESVNSWRDQTAFCTRQCLNGIDEYGYTCVLIYLHQAHAMFRPNSVFVDLWWVCLCTKVCMLSWYSSTYSDGSISGMLHLHETGCNGCVLVCENCNTEHLTSQADTFEHINTGDRMHVSMMWVRSSKKKLSAIFILTLRSNQVN